MSRKYARLLKKRQDEIALMKEAFVRRFFEISRRAISEPFPTYEGRVELLEELNAVHATITEAERDIAFLEAEAKKEVEATR